MIKYRPHRGMLEDAIKESREFPTLDDMFEHVVKEWNQSGFGQLFTKADLIVSESHVADKRV